MRTSKRSLISVSFPLWGAVKFLLLPSNLDNRESNTRELVKFFYHNFSRHQNFDMLLGQNSSSERPRPHLPRISLKPLPGRFAKIMLQHLEVQTEQRVARQSFCKTQKAR